MSAALIQSVVSLSESPFPPLAVGFMGLRIRRRFPGEPQTRPAEARRPGRAGAGFFHLGTGFWLMYLVFAVALNFVLKYTLPL